MTIVMRAMAPRPTDRSSSAGPWAPVGLPIGFAAAEVEVEAVGEHLGGVATADSQGGVDQAVGRLGR
jgi:hypothetical protein